MKLSAILLLAGSVMGVGQQIQGHIANVITKPGCEATVHGNGDIIVAPSSGAGDAVPQGRSAVAGTAPDSPKPLKCGKYQTFVPAHKEDCSNSMYGCWKDVPDTCVDNIHMLTEAEFQALIGRIRALEQRSK